MFKKLLSLGRSFMGDPSGGPRNSVYFYGMPKAGVHVDEHSALALSAVYACVSVIAKSLAALPFRVYESDGDARLLVSGDVVDSLIHRAPNQEITANILWRTLMGHVLTWGNGYAEIERNRNGEPVALWILTPDRVEPKRDDAGRLFYQVQQPNGQHVDLAPRFVLHLRGLGWDGIRGYSPVELARESISTGLANEQYAGDFFGNGAMPGTVITSEGTTEISPDGVKKLLSRFNKRHKGPGSRHKAEFIDPGMDIKAISVPPAEAQFLESRQFQVEDIARWYGVPLHKIGYLLRATNNNIEEQGIDFTVDTLQPWGDVLTAEVNAKLLTGGRYSKINYKARMQTDIKARGEFYRQMFGSGAYSPNDILRLEDENPVPGGDARFIPVNMMPLEEAAKLTAAGRNKPVTEQAAWPALVDACARMERKETKAIETAKHRGDSAEKVSEFYARHQTHCLEAVRPALEIIESITGAVFEQLFQSAHDAIAQHVARVKKHGGPIEAVALADSIMEAVCSIN